MGSSSPCFTGLEVHSSVLFSSGLPCEKQSHKKSLPEELRQVRQMVSKLRAKNTGAPTCCVCTFSAVSADKGYKFTQQ